MSFNPTTVKTAIRDLQRLNPRLTFVKAWRALQIKEPERFRESAEAERPQLFGREVSAEVAAMWVKIKGQIAAERTRLRQALISAEEPVVVTCELPLILKGEAAEEIHYLPKGRTTITPRVNGKPATITVQVDESTVARLQRDLLARLAGHVKPYGFFNHRDEKASFWPKSFYWDPELGVMLKVDWTKSGREAIEGRDYSHFSPTFVLDGDRVKGLADHSEIGSLTNRPAFPNLRPIACEADDDVYETDPWYH